MFVHNKRLRHTVQVAAPSPGLANLLLEHFGGPQGELAAACRYFTQAVHVPFHALLVRYRRSLGLPLT
jgi:Mn-containing catalase